jgi:hypothetical protein
MPFSLLRPQASSIIHSYDGDLLAVPTCVFLSSFSCASAQWITSLEETQSMKHAFEERVFNHNP